MHDLEESLRRAMADFFRVAEHQIGADWVLDAAALQGSLSRHALNGVVRSHVGRPLPARFRRGTFGQLVAAMDDQNGHRGRALQNTNGTAPARGQASGESTPTPDSHSDSPPDSPADSKRDSQGDSHREMPADLSPAAPLGTAAAAVRIGVDLQCVAKLPKTVDYWEHEFYRSTFTEREIVYCLQQPDSRASFAARWCAKEAAQKCDPRLLHISPTQLEVVHEADGAPKLRVEDASRRAPGVHYQLSLSHDDGYAMAVVLAIEAPPTAGCQPPEANLPIHLDPPRADEQRGGGFHRTAAGSWPLWISLSSLLLAGWALLRAGQ